MAESGESGNLHGLAGHAQVAGSARPVFISYASNDTPLAQKVCSALEAAGFPCWIAPRNVVPGTMYADEIVHAIDESSILVLILSEQAISSAHVGREIERAVSKHHPVVALRIDAAPLTAAFDQAGMEQAISNFERVLELDPSFAPAEVGLGTAYFGLGLTGFMPPAIAYEKARLANQRALKLDGNLALAHAQLADIYRVYDGDRAATDRELTKALALAPADGNILFYAAGQSIVMGRLEEALKQMNLALAQDPLNPSRYQVLSLIQQRRGRFEEAEAAARRAVEIVPTGPFGHYVLGDVLLLRSQPDAALSEFSKETIAGSRFDGSAMAYFALGRKADSDATLAKLIKDQANRPFDIARVYAFRGETDEAIKWLDQAYAQKDVVGISIIKTDPMFKKIEGDPRYKAFLKKMNLPE